jgi:hypothetical protein
MSGDWIVFNLPEEPARITRWAARQLNLRVVDQGDGSFRVAVRSAADAYHLGLITSTDPQWAEFFLGNPLLSGLRGDPGAPRTATDDTRDTGSSSDGH